MTQFCFFLHLIKKTLFLMKKCQVLGRNYPKLSEQNFQPNALAKFSTQSYSQDREDHIVCACLLAVKNKEPVREKKDVATSISMRSMAKYTAIQNCKVRSWNIQRKSSET